jgi:type IV pilus assembly protein PilE
MALRVRPGYTLLECMLVLAVAGILAGITIPGLQGQERRMGRLDAVQALTRVQAEEEAYRAEFGLYTTSLSALKGVNPVSAQGRYALSLTELGPQAYRASAQALGRQQLDQDCPALTLDVNEGYARIGPSPACWGR